MAGGRPPKPTQLYKVYGDPHPERHENREYEVRPEGDARPTSELTGEALAAWQHIVPRLMRMGLATEIDSHDLTMLCEWWGEYRRLHAATPEEVDPYKRINGMATASKQYRTIAAKFGLTPVDRVGLVGNNPTPEDEIAELIA